MSDTTIPAGEARSELSGLEELGRSIAQHGIQRPLLVRAEGGSLVLVDGHRRLAAAAQTGLAQDLSPDL